jgi:uncharacterized delta-60 repeat protein
VKDKLKLNILKVILATIFCGGGITITKAFSGTLDSTFNTNGIVITPIGTADDLASSMALQSDGKIVVAGSTSNGTQVRFALVRYNYDGSADPSFGANGKVATAFSTFLDEANAVAVQSDGKIVAAGYTNSSSNADFAIARYNSNGSLDTSFGNLGKVITPIGNLGDIIYGLAIQSDGKLVAAGTSSNGANIDFALARYNPDGTLDNSFGNGGKIILPIGNNADIVRAVALQSNGKIVVSGYSNNGVNNDIALARFEINGSPDNSFNGNGKIVIPIGSGNDEAYSISIQPDNKIIAAGVTNNNGNDDFALVRLNNNGSLDDSFNSNGKITLPIGNNGDSILSIALQSNGKIVAAGRSNNGTNEDFALARINYDGSLDTSFGNGGKIVTPILNFSEVGRSVAIQSDGKILVAGFTDTTGGNFGKDIVVVRYLNNGMPYLDFDGDRRTDIGIFRPAPAEWWYSRSSTNITTALQFGQSTDKIVPGDFTGDGKTDVAVYRPSNGFWFVLRSEDGSFFSFPFGTSGDIPAPAD